MTFAAGSPERDGAVEVDLDAERSAEAFAALYSGQYERLVRLGALLLGSTPAAEDVVQDAFAKLHVRFARVREPAAWLRTVVVNACRNERRHLGVARRVTGAATAAPPATHIDEAVDDVIDALRQLAPRQRAVVVLRFYEDLSEREIAEVLGVRPGTVKSTLHRALGRLREHLLEEDAT